MKPTLGRILLYMLSAEDAGQINRRRTSGPAIARRIQSNSPATTHWPLGAQAHIGNADWRGWKLAEFSDRLILPSAHALAEGVIGGIRRQGGGDTLVCAELEPIQERQIARCVVATSDTGLSLRACQGFDIRRMANTLRFDMSFGVG